MKVIFAAIACAALATASIAAETAKPTDVPKQQEVKKDPNRMVCRKTPVLGTRFPAKVCRTQTDWEKQAEIDKKNLDDTTRQGLANCATNPCT